jgi:lipopolysaccharide biosynthesis glycosyltransferase
VALESVNLSLLDDLEPYYFRLLAPTLLATEERAVYLDADILVRADPTPLLRWPLKGHPIAAVQDDYLRKIKHAISNYSDWGLDPELPYFNSGVMVMDLEWWRRENVANHVLTTCRSNSAYLRAQGQWPTYDQYGLNVVFANRWSVLPKIWNHSSLYPDDGACIVHFLGIGRPDSQSCHSIFREEFFALLAKTPWRGIIRFEQ